MNYEGFIHPIFLHICVFSYLLLIIHVCHCCISLHEKRAGLSRSNLIKQNFNIIYGSHNKMQKTFTESISRTVVFVCSASEIGP